MHIEGQAFPLDETGQLSAMLATLREVFEHNPGGFTVTADLASAFAAALIDMERAAHRLEQIKLERDEMEQESRLSSARDLDLIGHARSGEVGPASVARLSTPVGDTNVVTFPIVPRPAISRVDCQDDGGDAA